MRKASSEIRQAPYPILTGMAAGLVAGAVTGQVDKLLDRFVDSKQKKKDARVREGTAHEMAGPTLARRISGRRLSGTGKKRAEAVFNVAYSLLWGAIYAGVRKKIPQASRLGGLPFGIPFFFACDGMMAPLLKVSPNLRKIPWQPSAKEMGNHIAWTAAAEMVHRGVARAAARRDR